MKHFLFFLFTCYSLQAFSQSFEGKVTYQLAYETKLPTVTSEQWGEFLGTTQEYYIKNDRYKSIVDGSIMSWQLYDPDSTRLYTKLTEPDIADWTDTTVNPDSILGFQINKNVIEILGYSCDELVLDCVQGKQKYYFTSEIAVDPADYATHVYGNWAYVISTCKSIPLKMIAESEYLTLTTMATKIEAQVLDDALFKLADDIVIEKRPK